MFILSFIDTNNVEKAKLYIQEFDNTVDFLEKTYGPLELQMSETDYKFLSIVYEAISKFERSGCAYFT